MQMVEVLHLLHELPRADKFRAVQFLTAELAQEESPLLNPNAEYTVWSPCTTNQSAVELSRFLSETKRSA